MECKKIDEAPGSRARGRRWGAGLALVAATSSAQALGLLGGGSPSVLSPCPLPLVLLAFSPVSPFGVPILVAAGAAFWCWPLFRGSGHVPVRTIVLAALVGLTSAAWFISAAVQGLNVDGPVYAAVMVGASVLLGLATALAIRHARKNPGIVASAIAHGCTFVWLVSYAYAWFGEVP